MDEAFISTAETFRTCVAFPSEAKQAAINKEKARFQRADIIHSTPKHGQSNWSEPTWLVVLFPVRAEPTESIHFT